MREARCLVRSKSSEIGSWLREGDRAVDDKDEVQAGLRSDYTYS